MIAEYMIGTGLGHSDITVVQRKPGSLHDSSNIPGNASDYVSLQSNPFENKCSGSRRSCSVVSERPCIRRSVGIIPRIRVLDDVTTNDHSIHGISETVGS